jgi:putative Mn2+ efflux pump MntP
VLRLLAVVLPLGLDTFAVAASLGVAGLSRSQRARVSLVFAVFEGGMPLVGLLLGAGLSRVLGAAASWAAVAALAGVGLYMLLAHDDGAPGLSGARGRALVALGLGISLDELAIGFAGGLLNVPLLLGALLIAAQALLLSQLGLALGARIGSRAGEFAERVAAVALLALALLLGLQAWLAASY